MQILRVLDARPAPILDLSAQILRHRHGLIGPVRLLAGANPQRRERPDERRSDHYERQYRDDDPLPRQLRVHVTVSWSCSTLRESSAISSRSFVIWFSNRSARFSASRCAFHAAASLWTAA